PLEHRRQHRARHPIRGVDHDAQRLDRADIDEGQDAFDERRIDIDLSDTSEGLSLGPVLDGQGAVAHLQEARLAADRKRAPANVVRLENLRVEHRADATGSSVGWPAEPRLVPWNARSRPCFSSTSWTRPRSLPAPTPRSCASALTATSSTSHGVSGHTGALW